MNDPAPVPVGHQTQELRFATAMTGGVSLAIWMGGVARELNVLQRASHQRGGALPSIDPAAPPDANVQAIYLRLLNLLDTTVDVDILAGTSAGGINAALLAMARVNDVELAPLRGMWLKLGALEDLLRDPAIDAPPSLLQGDGKLLSGLQAGLKEVWGSESATPGPWPPTSVHLTTTLIEGETGRFTDAYGTLVQDVDHQGMFSFHEQQLSKPKVRDALATAGRSTASFPFAFEPGFVTPVEADGRPAMKDYANITRAHWVADGGLLMNRPIQPLLQEVFDRTAGRHVRRVLLYVVPSSGEQPDAAATPPQAELGEPLSLPEALLGDVKAVMAQSIASDLRAVRDHNDRVDSLVDTRLRMAQLGTRLRGRSGGGGAPDPHPPLAGMCLTHAAMFEDYCRRQSDRFARPVVAALMREVAALAAADLPPTWSEQLEFGSEVEADCRAAAAAQIAARWKSSGGDRDVQESWFHPLARFGLAAFDGAKATAIAMVRAAFVLAGDDDQRTALGRVLCRVHGALDTTGADGLAPESRGDDRFARPRVRDVVRQELAVLRQQRPPPPLAAVAATLATHYEDTLRTAAGDLDRAWAQVADALHGERATFMALSALVDRSDEAGAPAARDRLTRERAAAELRTYVAFLFGDGADPIAGRLFDLHVATRSVLPSGVDVEQPVELVQLSADTRTLLSDRSTAQEKLTGMQLHHFGAFYKSSWRASDWAWGRIDGAGWLVHLLLDPRRIELVAPPASDGRTRAQTFYDRLGQAIGAGAADGRDPTVVDELAFLDGASRRTSLPETAQWVAREIQRWIAAEELPVVAREMIANPSKKSDPWATKVLAAAGPLQSAQAALVVEPWKRAGDSRLGDELVAELTRRRASPQPLNIAMGELLKSCPVPDEKLEEEVGEPLMTRTVTKTAAVAGAMVNAEPPPIALLRAPLTALRTITMAAYRAAAAVKGAETLLLIGGFAAMVLGVAGLVTDTTFLGLAGATLFGVGFVLVTVVAWGRRWAKVVKGVATALVLGGALALVAAREWLFGDGTCAEQDCAPGDIGWFGREALPWLSDPWWHLPVVVVAFSVLSFAIGAIGARLAVRRKPEPPAPVPPAA